jgi:enterochelin esterase family protein
MSSGTFGRAVNGVVPGANLLEQIAPGFFADPAATNRKLRLLFFSCGTEDTRIDSLTRVEAELRSRQINFTFKRYPGEHEWKVWRHSLADMAPMLFR